MKIEAHMSGSSFRHLPLLLLLLLLMQLSIFLVAGQSAKNVPLNKWKQLGSIKDNEKFIYDHVKNKPKPGVQLSPDERNLFRNDTAPGFNPTGVAIIAGAVAEPDGCQPQEKSVLIPPNSDPKVMHWPTCTRLLQCGGCCGTDILECVPVRTELTTFQVMKVTYSDSGSGDFEFVGLEDVELTKHLECDCRCRIQANHCNPQKQDYNENSCSCRCRNEIQATSCPSQKRWDDKECACVCPRILNCLDDEFFSYNTCTCQRGSPMMTSSPTSSSGIGGGGADPCAGVSCRPGYRPVSTGTSCVCRIQSRRAAIRSRSVGNGRRPWSRDSYLDDELNW